MTSIMTYDWITVVSMTTSALSYADESHDPIVGVSKVQLT